MPRVLITGTTSGIGRGLLTFYDRAGWSVVACNRRQDAALEADHPRTQFLTIDVRDRAAINAYFDQAAAAKELPNLYYLNAGINRVDNLDGFALDVFQEVMDINLTGVLNFVDAALKRLGDQPAVFIVSSSTSNIFPNPNNLGYYVSKLGEAEMFRFMDQRYRDRGWRFKSLILGPVATNIFAGGTLSSKLQARVRDFLTVTVDDVVPRIARFAESRRQSFSYTKTAVLVFRTAALVKKLYPRFYQGSAPPPAAQ